METINHKNFFYPPGGILIWIIIVIEVVTFCAGIIAFAWQSNLSPEVFEVSQSTLNTKIGLVNTLLLLTSGFFVAESVRYLKIGDRLKSQKWMSGTMLFGVGFLILKGFEYVDKLQHGFDLTHDGFFTFYWLLTGFHFLHVLVGLVILLVLTLEMRKGVYHENNFLDIETGAAFWHMCDIIWLLLFPFLYLL